MKGLISAHDRPVLILGLLVLVVAGLIVQPYRAQQASRYALTAAVVDHGTVVLDEYEEVLGVDRAVRDGHTYSDKAPGQPFLAVPFYALGRTLGVEEATELRVDGNLGLWWVSFWSAAVPGALLAVLMYKRARSVIPQRAFVSAIAIGLGTLLLPFSSLLFGHVLAGLFLFASYLLLSGESTWPRLLAAGLLAGLAVTVEYTAFLGVLVLLVYAITRYRFRILPFLGGGAVAALLLMGYNGVAFGDPFVLSYQYTAFSEVTEIARPVTDMFGSATTLENLRLLFFSGRGLLLATPVVLVACAGAISRLRRGPQVDAAVGLAMFSLFILLPMFWGNPWGGDSPGARYLAPALPFLCVPLAFGWERWPRLTRFAAAISIITMVAATVTEPLLSRSTGDGLGAWLALMFRGEMADSLLTMALGRPGWVIHAVLLVGVGFLAFRVRDVAEDSAVSHPVPGRV